MLTLLLTTLAQAQDYKKEVVAWNGQQIAVHVFSPTGKAKKRPVLLALPPGEGTEQMCEATLAAYWLDEGIKRGYTVVSPAVLGSSLEQDPGGFVDAVLKVLATNPSCDARRVVLAGQSNGGRGAFYCAVARPRAFKAVVVIPGEYPGAPDDLKKLRGKPVWMLVGEQDDPERWLKPCQATADALEKGGAKVTLEILPGQGHVPRIPPSKLYDWVDKRR